MEFNALTEEDFYKILTEPRHSLIKQYQALLGAEGVKVEFDDGALWEMARYAYQVNRDTENIGARRLHTILEKVLEELNFSAPDLVGQTIPITAAYVQQRLAKIAENIDINRYILCNFFFRYHIRTMLWYTRVVKIVTTGDFVESRRCMSWRNYSKNTTH